MSGFQYKINDHSATFDPDDVWLDDAFQNRDDAARRLHSIVSGQERPLTICLNGEWGAGKTYFLTRFAQNYNMRQPKGRAVYFNAWEDDFLDDPLLAIICQLKKAAPDVASQRLLDSVKKAAIPCLKKIGMSVVKQVMKNKVGVDVDAIETEDLESAAEVAYRQYDELENSRALLREKLTSFAEEAWKETEKPLLFIVDELDRCRPTFAIEVLERIKHLFTVPHLVFLVGTDVRQLEKSICAVYGEIDANDYLHRFFDLEVRLPASDKTAFLYNLWQEYGLEDAARKQGVGTDSQRCTIDEFAKLFKYRNVSLRQIEKCVRTYAFLSMSADNGTCKWSLLAAIAVVLKVTNDELYRKFINLEIALGELINALYPGVTSKQINDDGGIFSMAEHLTKIAYYRSDSSEAHKHLEVVKKNMSENKALSFDPVVMPLCFKESNSGDMVGFYQYVLNEERMFRAYGFAEVPAVLQRMNYGLQFLGR